MIINPQRIRHLNDISYFTGAVCYWMQRDQRMRDNWALIYAQQQAIEHKQPLIVLFNLVPDFLEATIRQYGFMLKGLQEIEKQLQLLDIPLVMLMGNPGQTIPEFVSENKIGLLISDFNPLKISRLWKIAILDQIKIPFESVDAHNIVPCWVASDKLEFAARTIRPKIHNHLGQFLHEFPEMQQHPFRGEKAVKPIDWEQARASLRINEQVKAVDWLVAGETAAHQVQNQFLNQKLTRYGTDRNDPNKAALSNLSPYLHFGQISAQRVALEVNRHYEEHSDGAILESKNAFLEELIVRRELSDNFCLYNPQYDSFSGFHPWAQKTLNDHRADPRDYVYDLDQFEQAKTHDPLWNAAQSEMVNTGKMHGYMRMYWAKKILEWTASPEDALKTAIYLNDTYQLDGRDPNGYVGIAWSIGGVHDRAWTERPIFGKIRYMNFNGCKRKFDVDRYFSG